MSKIPISLVIITLNEENNIARCIQSVPFADEVIIVDSGSSDKTLEIAESLGAKISFEKWQGFYHQKNKATELAKNDWVLSLDADEALGEDSQNEILDLMSGKLEYDGYIFPRLSFHLGRWIWHGGWYPDKQLRFFNKNKCHWKNTNVHEHVVGENIKLLKKPILHYVFKDLAHQVDTNNRYSGLGTQDLISKNKKFSLFRLVTKPISKFIECYFFKRGILDGMPGFIIAVSASYSIFLKFAKLWEYEKVKVREK
ncbi:MAG: glycosyltransferase family 2 protein [Bdellovibrionaceae bacterium]|jgi:glycosyltransferase involved in cell wall biosynthesis|nr:glycosyltransferase family 2 protein [Pseudobdellovibrionaceae bacterium]